MTHVIIVSIHLTIQMLKNDKEVYFQLNVINDLRSVFYLFINKNKIYTYLKHNNQNEEILYKSLIVYKHINVVFKNTLFH